MTASSRAESTARAARGAPRPGCRRLGLDRVLPRYSWMYRSAWSLHGLTGLDETGMTVRSSLHHLIPVGLRGLDDHSSGNTILLVGREHPPHDLDDFGAKERHQSRIIDPKRPVPADPHVREPGSFELLGEDTLRQGPRHSPGPCALIVRDLWGQLALDREIRHADPTSRPEQSEHLRERSALSSRQVQDAIGDHHVDRLVRKRDVFHLSRDELGPALDAGHSCVATSPLAHLLEDVESDSLPFRSDALGGEDGVDPSPRADVQHALARLEKAVADGVPHRKGPLHGPGGYRGELVARVHAAGDCLAATRADRRIRLSDSVFDLLLEHEVLGHGSSYSSCTKRSRWAFTSGGISSTSFEARKLRSSFANSSSPQHVRQNDRCASILS